MSENPSRADQSPVVATEPGPDRPDSPDGRGPDSPEGPDGPGGRGPDNPRGRRHRRGRGRRWLVIGAWAFVAALVAAALVVPMPYVADGPGPTVDVTGRYGSTDVITITGTDPRTGKAVVVDPAREAGDTTGELRMVTVSESGGPGDRLNLFRLVDAWVDPRVAVVPYSQAYPTGVTETQVEQVQSAQMQSSQSTAGVAALEELGYTVPATVTIEGTVEGSGAVGAVEKGDVLEAITTADGTTHRVDSASVPFAVMKEVPVGSTVHLTVRRGGRSVDAAVRTMSGGAGTQGSKLGIYLSADVSMPLDVRISLEHIGGPSAGMMFALGVIDRLTPGDMTGGQSIAGTGTMSYDGEVGAIGGIRQKMFGAVRDGATWFLAPASNCGEVVGHEPRGLEVVAVSTLGEARSAVSSIAAGSGGSLRTCEAEQSGSGASGR